MEALQTLVTDLLRQIDPRTALLFIFFAVVIYFLQKGIKLMFDSHKEERKEWLAEIEKGRKDNKEQYEKLHNETVEVAKTSNEFANKSTEVLSEIKGMLRERK
ncbi:MAG: hypothetical protein RJQ09_21265 [Cyclobacteriaceae bacterium]